MLGKSKTSGDSDDVDSLFVVAPIVCEGLCYVPFCGVSLCILLLSKGELVVFHQLCLCYSCMCSVSLPRGAMERSVFFAFPRLVIHTCL